MERWRDEPPRSASRLLRASLPHDEREAVLGDLHEAYLLRARAGRVGAACWYWCQALLFAADALVRLLPGRRQAGQRVGEAPDTDGDRRFSVEVVTMWTAFGQTTRRLARDMRFSAAMTAILAIGIGAGLVGYSVVDRVLLRPLPYERPLELSLLRVDLGSITDHPGISMAEIADIRGLADVFAGVESATAERRSTLETPDGPESVLMTAVTPGLFGLLGVDALLGRTFLESDLVDGGAGVVVSHAFWQARLGGDPDVLDRTLTLDGTTRPVLGVMPEGFAVHMGRGANVSADIELWLPLTINPDQRNFWGFRTLARLRAGSSHDHANAALAVLASRLLSEYPDDYGDAELRFVAHPLQEDLVRESRPAINTALAGVGLLLLVAFANGASLMLGRQRAREADLAVRAAIGAARGRLVATVLGEAFVLALGAGVLGGALAAWSVAGLRALDPPGVPRWNELSVDWTFFLVALALALVGFLASGLYPALKVSAGGAWRMLRGESAYRGSSGTAARRALVGVQVALSVTLLFAATVLGRSASRLADVDLGFHADGVLTLAVPIDHGRFSDLSERWAFHRDLRARFLTLPGVVEAGAVTHLPLSGYAPADAFGTLDADSLNWDNQLANYFGVTPGYLETLGVELLRGRSIDDRDWAEAEHVTVVDESLAEALFPGENPVGREIKLGWGIQTAEIVGVIRHPRVMDARMEVRPQAYVPQSIFGFEPLWYAVRTTGAPGAIASAARSMVREAGSGRAVFAVRPLAAYRDEATSSLRLTLALIALQAVLTGLLSGFGLFSVIAYLAHQRRRETAIRGALGATRGDLLRHHLRWGAWVLGGGVPLGIGVSLAGSVLLESLVYDVSARDLASMAAATTVAVTIGLLATYVPARGAATIDPMEALRGD